MALNGNPTILLPLFAPAEFTRFINSTGQELRDLTPHLLSRRVGSSFLGYLDQQLKRLTGKSGQKRCTRPELIERHGFDTKYAGHVIRLGLQGVELLSTGKLTLPMPEPDRQLVRAVRRGKASIQEVERWGNELIEKLKREKENSPPPEAPNSSLAEEWMMDTYLRHWKG